MSDNAKAHDVHYEQTIENHGQSTDLARLAEELDRLKAVLATEATDRDHYAAIVAVSDAAAEARAGKGSNALSKLASAGKWAFEIATKIGVTVAAEALKDALGMGKQ